MYRDPVVSRNRSLRIRPRAPPTCPTLENRRQRTIVLLLPPAAHQPGRRLPFEVLDRAGCIAAEPGLAYAEGSIAGGLRLPKDETGDWFKFTNLLAGLRSIAKQSEPIRKVLKLSRLVVK